MAIKLQLLIKNERIGGIILDLSNLKLFTVKMS